MGDSNVVGLGDSSGICALLAFHPRVRNPAPPPRQDHGARFVVLCGGCAGISGTAESGTAGSAAPPKVFAEGGGKSSGIRGSRCKMRGGGGAVG